MIVLMGSGCEAAHETVDCSERARRKGRRAEGAAVIGRSTPSFRRSAAADGTRASPCSIARRSRARKASRSISIVVNALYEAGAE